MTLTDPADSLDYDVLLQRCADRAYNFALRLCGNDQEAQDLVQEAFARAFEKRDRYDPKRPFSSWLFKILQNIFLDSRRRLDRKNTVSLDAETAVEDGAWTDILPGPDAEPLDLLVKNEEERRLQQALKQLPHPYRTAVVLFDIERLSYEDMAELMNVPVGTVGSRVHNGRMQLKKILSRMENDKAVKPYAS